MGALLGEGVSLPTVVRAAPAAAVYDVLLAPFVVPVIAMAVRRLAPDPTRQPV
jgi:hypothetical protein